MNVLDPIRKVAMMKTKTSHSFWLVMGNALTAVALATYFFFLPGCLVLWRTRDPALKEAKIPREL